MISENAILQEQSLLQERPSSFESEADIIYRMGAMAALEWILSGRQSPSEQLFYTGIPRHQRPH